MTMSVVSGFTKESFCGLPIISTDRGEGKRRRKNKRDFYFTILVGVHFNITLLYQPWRRGGTCVLCGFFASCHARSSEAAWFPSVGRQCTYFVFFLPVLHAAQGAKLYLPCRAALCRTA